MAERNLQDTEVPGKIPRNFETGITDRTATVTIVTDSPVARPVGDVAPEGGIAKNTLLVRIPFC
jgi:hypothetical protein